MRKRTLVPVAALATAALLAPPGGPSTASAQRDICVAPGSPVGFCVREPQLPQLWYCLYGSYGTVLGQEICRPRPDPT